MAKRKPLRTLIPLDDLKRVLAKIVAVPKGAIKVNDAKAPDRKAGKPKKGGSPQKG